MSLSVVSTITDIFRQHPIIAVWIIAAPTLIPPIIGPRTCARCKTTFTLRQEKMCGVYLLVMSLLMTLFNQTVPTFFPPVYQAFWLVMALLGIYLYFWKKPQTMCKKCRTRSSSSSEGTAPEKKTDR